MSYLVAAYIICFALLAIYLVILGGRVAALTADNSTKNISGLARHPSDEGDQE